MTSTASSYSISLKDKEMDSALTEKGDLEASNGSNSHGAFLSSLSYSDSEIELEIELEEGECLV